MKSLQVTEDLKSDPKPVISARLLLLVQEMVVFLIVPRKSAETLDIDSSFVEEKS